MERRLLGVLAPVDLDFSSLDVTVHTRPDGDFELFGIQKCTARDLKTRVLHTASHGVSDLVTLTCLTS